MTTMKCWRLKLKGELSLDQVQEALRGRAASILRIDNKKGETHVYYSGSEEHRLSPGTAAHGKADEAEEVSVDEVTKT